MNVPLGFLSTGEIKATRARRPERGRSTTPMGRDGKPVLQGKT